MTERADKMNDPEHCLPEQFVLYSWGAVIFLAFAVFPPMILISVNQSPMPAYLTCTWIGAVMCAWCCRGIRNVFATALRQRRAARAVPVIAVDSRTLPVASPVPQEVAAA